MSVKRVSLEGLGLTVYVDVLRFRGTPEDAARLSRALPGECAGHTVVAGVPGPEPPSPCTVAVALVHALEARARGSRVRSLPLLFLMELLGVPQVRDAVERVAEARYLVVASLEEDCARAGAEAAGGLAGGEVEAGCSLSEASEATLRSVLDGPRLRV